MWDMHTQHVQKREDGSLAVSYAIFDEDGLAQTSLEVLKHTFSETFLNGKTTYLIKESVNDGQETRFYEMVGVPNQMNHWRVTQYAQHSPTNHRERKSTRLNSSHH